MIFQSFLPIEGHRYYVFSSGTDFKARNYPSRKEAEAAMLAFCAKKGLNVECTERDRHERKYSNHMGVRFYINRV